ncbi:MAG: glycoside hydrolase family 2 TIM barrel-domain containing protein, partial [Candidatus Brocadiaceae bacterium]
MRISRCLLAVALCVLVVALAGSAGAAEYAWFEGEEPDSTNYDVAFGGWGNVDYLSEGDWLHVELDDGDLAGVPEEGIRIGYAFEVSASGDHEVWARLGYDHLWVPFQWRVDGGEWRTVRNDHTPTVDHMEIQRWNALVWTMLGEADLSAGAHTLQIRIPVPEPDAEGKRPRFLYAADAFCIHGGSFRPNGKHRPGAEWRAQRDLEAAEMVFRLPEADAEGKRTEMSLEGRWQLARYDDPDAIENRLGPIPDVPPAAELHWSSIGVPGDRNQSRPDLAHCHRYLYRTRVFVPESHAGHSFFLEFPQVSMIGTLFVNGERCGWTKAPYALWRCDVTDAIRPGEVNEVWVGIKDTVYAMSPELMGPDQTLRQFFKVPLDDLRQNQGVTMKFDMPVALWTATGILDRPLFVSAGEVYAEDVFAIPSVQEEKLGLEVTLRNPTDRPVNVELANKVVPWKGGDVEKRFAPQQVTVPARGKTCIELSEGWADPKLWWPDSPHLYNVATTLRRDGHVLDVKKTRFGFREWDWSGTKFRLNGVPWQFRSDHGYGGGALPLEGVRKLKASGQNIVRLTEGMGATWCGLNSRHTIGFFDEQGIAVRRGTIWNGMFASYQLARRVEVDGKRVKRPNRALFDNTREAILAFVRGQRNHPSILIWSLENEIIYINARNLGNLDVTEPEVRKISDAVMALDPTRPTMVDGGRALTDQSLPVNGCHYPEANVRNYPDEAYVFEKSRQTGRSKPWPMAMDKPIFLGESYYSGGKSPSWYATLGGERCFIGIAECEYARGLFAKMLAEGYRWFGIAAFDFLVRPNIHTNSFRPVAVFCREWNWTFASGDTVERTLKAFNDTRHDDPVDVHWRLELGGEPVDEGSRRCEMAPGSSEMFGISLSMPDVAERTEGHLILTCERRGEQVFREEKDVSVLPPDAGPRPEVQPGELAVYDPSGPVRERLRRRGIAFTKVDDPGALPDGWEVLVLGPDSLSEKDALSPRWRRLAAGGRRILVLDQEQPLQHDAVPADVELTDFVGRVAFMENPTHPAFEGLKQKDFFCWSRGHVVYRNVYRKPTRGGQSLMQCDVGLACTALVECPVQDGLL